MLLEGTGSDAKMEAVGTPLTSDSGRRAGNVLRVYYARHEVMKGYLVCRGYRVVTVGAP